MVDIDSNSNPMYTVQKQILLNSKFNEDYLNIKVKNKISALLWDNYFEWHIQFLTKTEGVHVYVKEDSALEATGNHELDLRFVSYLLR